MDSNLAVKPGSEVEYGERRFVIMQVIGFETVVARDVESGELERLAIADLRPVSSPEPSVLPPDLAELDDRDWAEARRRLDLIEPVLEKARLPRSVMAERARAGGVEVTTLYRWARAFRTTGLASGIPVIAMEAPPVPDERRFYAEILRQVFTPFRASKSAGQLRYEVLRLLATVEVKLLIIDEIQHVLAGPLLKQRQFLNVIKHLGNELQIPIVAAGTQDAFNAIQTDPQLANRFEPAVLRRWRGLPATVGQFRGRAPTRAPLWARRAGVGTQNSESVGGDYRRDLSASLPGCARCDRTWRRADHERLNRALRVHHPLPPAACHHQCILMPVHCCPV